MGFRLRKTRARVVELELAVQRLTAELEGTRRPRRTLTAEELNKMREQTRGRP